MIGAAVQHDESAGSVQRYVWHPTIVPAPDSTPAALAGRSIAILGGARNARTAVVAALEAVGARTIVVEPPQSSATALADSSITTKALAEAVAEAVHRAGPVDAVVDLNLDDATPTDALKSWRAALTQTVAAIQSVYDDWAAEGDARRCGYLAVTRLGGRMGYDGNGIGQPLGGIWAGFAKSLPYELPACRIKVLDVAEHDPETLAGLIVLELSIFDYYEVGWRDGVRTTLACRNEQVPPPQLDLSSADVVLLSGGARGIGFKLAVSLATAHGCQVVVTGRRALPDPHEPWLAMDDEAFGEFQRNRLVQAIGANLGAIRRENNVLAGDRESAFNLAEARRRGLAITYEKCDVRVPDEVRRLVAGIGGRLRLVVHNAGIAAPTRLRNKDIDVVLDVVGCKVEGFVNLAEALRGRNVELFCNVGSASGRIGGMVGQIDYAAANEALTRLGFWACAEHRLPVTTLAWTTWDRIGLIANFDAALRYGTALPVDDGIAKWTAELLAARPGEVMFLGRVGTALVPTQLAGLRKFIDHPDYDRLHSMGHFLGEVEEYRPFRCIRSNIVVQAEHPWADTTTIAGTPGLPVSIALEYAASLGDWVAPQGWAPRHLTEIRDVRVDIGALALRDGRLELRREAAGSRVDGRWCVDVTMHRADDHRGVLHARLVYDDSEVSRSQEPTLRPRNGVTLADASPVMRELRGQPDGLAWRGLAIRAADWWDKDDTLRARVRPTSPADIWALPNPPHHVLPTHALESILAAHATLGDAAARRLTIRTLRQEICGREATLEGSPATGQWTVFDATGSAILVVEGMSLH
jgi:NAD(P)-dependent dehydrogenase (short-subunit alcohol dehydrogenase family)